MADSGRQFSRARPFLGLALAVLGLAGAFGLYFFVNPSSPYGGLVISEVMTSNGETIADEDGDFRDWLELENRGSSEIDLSGVLVERDGDASWEFPPIILSPGDRLLIWASSKDRSDPTSDLHTSFRLSRDGVRLELRSPEATLIHQMSVPALARDATFGLHPAFSEVLCFFPEPTPGSQNSNMCIEEARTR